METNVKNTKRVKLTERLFVAAMLLIVVVGVGAAMQGRSTAHTGGHTYIYEPMTGDQLADYLLNYCRENGKSPTEYAGVIERCRKAGNTPAIEVMRNMDVE